MDNENNKFDWAETVKIRENSPIYLHPGEIVSVCGMTKIESEILAEKYESDIGEWLYTIEYSDGSDVEIPERYLEKYENEFDTFIFHDGSIIDIQHVGDSITFAIESSQIEPKKFNNREMLSQSHTLKGSLYLSSIKSIEVENMPHNGILQKLYDNGKILDLEINSNHVVFIVQWSNFPPKQPIIATNKIEIEAKHVQWIPEINQSNAVTQTRIRDVIKHKLDFDRVFSYFVDHIDSGNTLSRKIIKEIDLSKGTFFTYLPIDAKIEKLYDFCHGGIIPLASTGNKYICAEDNYFYPSQLLTDEPCSKFIRNHIRSNIGNLAVLESYLMESYTTGNKYEDPEIKKYDDEIYFVLNINHSLKTIYQTLWKCSLSSHFFAILTNCKKELNLSLTNLDLQEMCNNLKYVIAGAYDGEGYIFWEKENDRY